jgi:hypothetical protein
VSAVVKDIATLKARFRSAVIDYRARLGAAGYDCGSNLAAHINPKIAAAAHKANNLAAELKAIDPDFPASWVPYPEGT